MNTSDNGAAFIAYLNAGTAHIFRPATPESLELSMQSEPCTAQLYSQFPTIDAAYAYGRPGAQLTTHDRARALIVRGRFDSRAVLAGRIGS